MFLGTAGGAQAAFDGSELQQFLAWLWVVPIGMFQLLAAFVARKHAKRSPVAWTLLAVVASLAAGLVATLTVESYLVPILAIVMVIPGVPLFASLVRERMLQIGFILLLLPPFPIILWLWDNLR